VPVRQRAHQYPELPEILVPSCSLLFFIASGQLFRLARPELSLSLCF
jgi:hypothetical protein